MANYLCYRYIVYLWYTYSIPRQISNPSTNDSCAKLSIFGDVAKFSCVNISLVRKAGGGFSRYLYFSKYFWPKYRLHGVFIGSVSWVMGPSNIDWRAERHILSRSSCIPQVACLSKSVFTLLIWTINMKFLRMIFWLKVFQLISGNSFYLPPSYQRCPTNYLMIK